jgi:uncharacterized membrane protein YkoI
MHNSTGGKMMKVNPVATYVTVVMVSASLALLAFGKEEKEEAVSWSQVPAAAQQTIKQRAPETAIKKIQKDEEDGKVAYEFQIVQSGKKSEITVAADGKLLSVEEEVVLADVPSAVRHTMETQATGGKLGTLEKVTEDGKTVFEAKVEKGGKRLEITVAPDGKITGTEDVTKEKE